MNCILSGWSIIYSIIFLLIFIIYFDIYDSQLKTRQMGAKLLMKYDLHLLFNQIDTSNPSDVDLLNLLNKQIELPKLDNYDTIPNILFQIYMYYTGKIPDYIFDGIKTYAPNYKHIIFNELDAKQFLTLYFHKRIIERFNNLKLGAHKADLLRYCYLYIYGGVYIDIKTLFIKPLDEIFTNKSYFYTCIESLNGVMYNGILASKPRNILFLKLIWYIINIPLYKINAPFRVYYLTFCQDIYLKIQNDCKTGIIQQGLNIGKTQNYYLFKDNSTFNISEICSKFDRYGACNNVYDNETRIFIGRDSEFPWK